MLAEDKFVENGSEHKPAAKVGYKHPPVHSRFKPGQSGNPSGRTRGSKNIRTLFKSILKEQVSLREGAQVRQVSKREAILRGLVVGAMKGDPRSVATLMRLAEQTGELDDGNANTGIPQVTIFKWQDG